MPADLGPESPNRDRRPPRALPPCGRQPRKQTIVSDTKLIQVTDAADTALGAFDFSAHEGKGVRVFIQGFG